MSKTTNKLSSDRHIDFINNIKDNLNKHIENRTLQEIADDANVPFSTLKNILYGNSTDCKLSTAVKLAKALGISIDELVDSDTMIDSMKESMQIYRQLPERSQYLVRWFIKHQKAMYTETSSVKTIGVMVPKDFDKYLHPTNHFESLSIDNYSNSIKAKVFIGLKIPVDYYMPYYSPFDTLLIANDRKPLKNEHCIILYYGKLKIVTRKERIENGNKIIEYIPIQNNRNKIKESDIDEYIGYVAEVHREIERAD